MNRAVIGAGSNIEPKINIGKARDMISKNFLLLAESEFVISRPLGNLDQPDFLNGAFLIETDLEINDLNKALKEIEHDLGRVRGKDKNAPRTIDLDIVVWNGQLVDNDVYRRDFLKKAVLQLLPDLKIIQTGIKDKKS